MLNRYIQCLGYMKKFSECQASQIEPWKKDYKCSAGQCEQRKMLI
jgi:hypothetical protein